MISISSSSTFATYSSESLCGQLTLSNEGRRCDHLTLSNEGRRCDHHLIPLGNSF